MTEQLTGMDAAFLALETPELPMHVVGVLLLDPSAGDGYSAAALRQVIADRLHLMPPFCRRLVDVPLSLDKPYWHYDADIDLDRHVHTASLPAPGDLRALGSLVGEIASERLDRRLPLWELHIVDGLADGRAALIAKVHHSTLYGAAGAEFIAELLDLSPETRTVEPPAQGATSAPPGSLALARRTAGRQLRRPVELGQAGLSAVGGAVRMARDLTGVLSRHGRAALPSPAPRMPISGAATERRTAAFTALPLELTRATKDAAGVKLNDVVLAVVAMAVRRYLAARDITPGRDLVASVPLNAGEGESAGTNALAAMLVPLPMNVDDPSTLLGVVHEATLAAKAFTAAVGTTTIAELAELTPPVALSFVTWLTRSLGLTTVQPPLSNFIVSNVVGPPIPLYLAGAQVDAIYPLGPLLPGAGMNLTVLSNLDRLDVGIMACPDLVDDVWSIADALPACLDELAAAVAG